jgi:uncharacterized 2Fe-2S/4Fe-4S cluster protein (DUF4445 family)
MNRSFKKSGIKMDQAINIDIGTSGIRAQLLNLMDSSVLRTAILSRNPLPGASVVDHMDFAISYGQGIAHGILISALNSHINNLKPGNLKRKLFVETLPSCRHSKE